jgi:cyclase
MKPKNIFSKDFRIKIVSDGIWIAEHVDGGSHICDSGIIDLGEETLIIDTGLTPQTAHKLRKAATCLTGRKPNFVVNGHWHEDHVRGNQVFQDTLIISSEETRRILVSKGASEIEKDYNNAKNGIDDINKQLKQGTEEGKAFAKVFAGYLQGMIDAYPVFRPTPPNITFNGSMSIHGSEKTVQLTEYRDAHSESDVVTFIPEDRLLFCGDLCYHGWHPCIDMGNPLNILRILDELKKFGAEVVVPSHTGFGGVEILDYGKEYINTLKALVQEVVDRGGSVEDACAIPVPEEYRALKLEKFFYKRSLKKLYEVLKK